MPQCYRHDVVAAPSAEVLSVEVVQTGVIRVETADSTFECRYPAAGAAAPGPPRTSAFAPTWVGDLDGDGNDESVQVIPQDPAGALTIEQADGTRRVAPQRFAYVESLDVHDGRILVGEGVAREGGVPLNRMPRLLVYDDVEACIAGAATVVDVGNGYSGAHFVDVDGDGAVEILGFSRRSPAEVYVFKSVERPLYSHAHRTLDSRKLPSTDLFVADVDGDGLVDIVSGRKWYQAPDWTPHTLPGVSQAIAAADIDGDGALEIVATEGENLSNRLCLLDRTADGWSVSPIGVADADWPHGAAAVGAGSAVGPCVLTAYHRRDLHAPQVWRPANGAAPPWSKSTLAEISYGEEMVVVDLDGDGVEEIVAGPWWLKLDGERWTPYRIADSTYTDVTRCRVADVDGDGRLDVVVSEEGGDWPRKIIFSGRITWFEQPNDPREAWTEHVVAIRTCPHSLDVYDVDGDGEVEIVVGEHDPFTPEGAETFCRLSIFKRVLPG